MAHDYWEEVDVCVPPPMGRPLRNGVPRNVGAAEEDDELPEAAGCRWLPPTPMLGPAPVVDAPAVLPVS